MNFDLSETQKLFQSTVERFTRDVDIAGREKIRANTCAYDMGRWAELAELGLLAVAANEEQGGLDGSLIDLSTIAETFGFNNALDPWLENGALPIRLLGVANKTDLLDTLLDGSSIAALAFAEPNARYDTQAIATQASKDKNRDGFILNGRKRLVMGGAFADTLLVTANQDSSFGIYCVPNNAEGVTSQCYRLADGSFATEISLNDVEVPATAKLSINSEEFQQVVAEISILACAEMLGLSQLLLNDTIAYVKERRQFDVSIGSFQAIQHGLVDCFSELEQMRSMLYRTLLLEKNSTSQWHANAMGAKSFIGDGANFIARNAVQYHGAMGITDEVAVGHAMKRIMILTRLFGDSSHSIQSYLKAV